MNVRKRVWNVLEQVANFTLGVLIGAMLWTLGEMAIAEMIPVHGHWPDVPLVGTSCDKIIHDLPLTEPDNVEYNSVVGLATFIYEFTDGTVITLTYNVLDIVHESAADYSIKVDAHPLWYTFKYLSLYEMWMDRLGNGDCNDYHLRIQ